MRRALACLLGVLALAAAGPLERGARESRPALRQGQEGASPALPPTVQLASTMLGSFRALLVDYLWIKAEALQNEGRYFAAAEVARWITLLQSRVEGSWSFQAWNLGVNVPSSLPPEERWPYVHAAMELLWNDGLGANPGSLGLHAEIAWFWESKIGGDVDAAAPRYRAAVEARAREILGPEPWDLGEQARAEALLPALRHDPVVQDFLQSLASLGIRNAEAQWTGLWDDAPAAFGDSAEELAAALRDEPLLRAYDRALRARAWREAFGVDCATVSAVHERFGDVGVMLPDSFVLYWAQHGLAQLEPGAVRLDALALWRIELRALKRLFRAGRAALLATIDREYAEIIDRVAADEYHGEQAPLFAADRIEFLRDGVPLAYISGTRTGRQMAVEFFRKLAELDPARTPRVACEDYVFDWVFRRLGAERATKDELLAVARAFLREALRATARGEAEGARAYLAFARELYDEAAAAFGGPAFPRFEDVVAAVRGELAGPRAKERAMRAREGAG